MSARDVKKNVNLFVDGQGLAGQIEDFTPPVLEVTGDKFRGGGMAGSTFINTGFGELATDFSLISFSKNVLALMGVAQGVKVPFVAREFLESHDGSVTAVEHCMTGTITKLDQGSTKPGDKATLKVHMELDYYKLTHGGEVIHEHDVVNMIHIVNGVDQTAAQRAALGM